VTSPHGQCRGDEGAGLVAGFVLLFAFTFLGLVWLARDVDRSVSNRSAAQSIAFQAARSGAQAADVSTLRGALTPALDEDAARRAAAATATTLFTSYGLTGSITEVQIEADRVTVSVAVTDAGRTVTGTGTVRAERAP
jgi:Tfp pilus assembly protein PilX